jgi:hypothetical protein
VTKLSLEAFTKALERKDKIDPEDKMIILQGIEEALRILFPNCEIQGEDVDMTWEASTEGDDSLSDEENKDAADAEVELEENKRVKPKLRVNPKTGETEVQLDVELPQEEDEESNSEDFELPSIPDLPDESDAGSESSSAIAGSAPTPLGVGAPPAPPPPPGIGPPPLPGKGAGAFVGIKLKRFNWIKVPPGKLKRSMWVQAEKNTKGIVLDQKTLESLFFVPTGKEKEELAKPAKNVSILDLQRANNVGTYRSQLLYTQMIDPNSGILLCRFTISFAEIKRAILNCDEKILTLDTSRALIRLAPTKDEV